MNKKNPETHKASVRELVEKKIYFVEAMRWYEQCYLFRFTERSMVLACVFVLVFVALFVAGEIYIMFPLKKDFPVVRQVESEDVFARLAHLKIDKSISTQDAVAKHLIESYVLQRESFGLVDIREQLDYVKNNSSYQVFRDYQDFMSIDNVNSPLVKYRDKITRRANIRSTSLKRSKEGGDEAVLVVDFALISGGRVTKNESRTIRVGLVLSDVALVHNNVSPFSFVVTKYNVSEVF